MGNVCITKSSLSSNDEFMQNTHEFLAMLQSAPTATVENELRTLGIL